MLTLATQKLATIFHIGHMLLENCRITACFSLSHFESISDMRNIFIDVSHSFAQNMALGNARV